MKRHQDDDTEAESPSLLSELWHYIFTFLRDDGWCIVTAPAVCHSWAAVIRHEVQTLRLPISFLRRPHPPYRLNRVPALRILHVSYDRHKVKGLKHLTALTSLTLVSGDASGKLKNLVNLTELKCRYHTQLPLMTNLKTLGLYDSVRVTDNEMKRFTGLRSLTISGSTLISPTCLAGLTTLTYLSMSRRNECGATISTLTNLTSLELSIATFSYTDAALRNLKGLTRLSLTRPKITGESLLHLSRLTYLFIEQPHPQMSKYFPTTLKTLECVDDTASSNDFPYLPNLETLSTDSTLEVTKDLLVRLPNLCVLSTVRLVLDKSILRSDLSKLTHLEINSQYYTVNTLPLHRFHQDDAL